MKDSNSIEEMKKALKCLYLEVDSSIADDLIKRFETVVKEWQQSQQPIQDNEGLEKLARKELSKHYLPVTLMEILCFKLGWKAKEAAQQGNGKYYEWVKASDKKPLMNDTRICMRDGYGIFIGICYKHNTAIWHTETETWIYDIDFIKYEWLKPVQQQGNISDAVECSAGKIEHNKSIFHLGQCQFCFGNKVL